MNKPTGLITFLFTDIEGSTRLAQEFPRTLQAALEKHHAIMHKVIESNNGFVFEIVGDAFCCAFENAEDAIKAAVDAQINLANEKWDGVRIKIRIGIHTGNAEWNGKRYMGYITLARTARVMSAAYGEQIIISNDTYEFAKEKIPNKISFRDLGERRLKDLKQPVRLFQILSEGLREDFPLLKTLDARPNNLPVQLTSFIGREAEMKLVKDLLKQTHLLTLTGSGGAGKTRLALQVAADVIDDFANGVWFVELASLSEPAFLPQAIMKVFEIKEEPKRSLEDTLCDYLKDKEILIILDNCEHLIEPCANLTEKLLNSCPKLKIIATSREGLRCGGEQTHRVLSLDVPDPKDQDTPEQLSQFEAVRLFIERALAVDSTFRVNNNNAPALAEICFQLDGIPLAIELAAARTKVLTVEQIYERLNDRFNLLTGGKRTALPRQQTLRALIDWSYDLLSKNEQILWSRLSVFSGGWTLEAAEEVCLDEKIKKEEVLELLNQLTEKSIIIFEKDKERYSILETLKRYGEEKLKEAYELEVILTKHLQYLIEFSEKAEPKLKGSNAEVWLEKLELEHSNLQSAIEWSVKDGNQERGAQLAGSLGYFWSTRGHYSTGKRLLDIVHALGVSKSARGRTLNISGILSFYQGDFKIAQKLYEESLAINRELMDKQNIANSLSNLGVLSDVQCKFEQAQKFYRESFTLRRDLKDKYDIADILKNLGILSFNRGYFEQAQKFSEKSLAIFREIGVERGISICLVNIGNVSSIRGNYEQAYEYFEESLSISRKLKDKNSIAGLLNNLGVTSANLGNYENAHKFYEESLTLNREYGDKGSIINTLNNLGNAAFDQGKYEQAQIFYKESLAMGLGYGHKRGNACSLSGLGSVALVQENYEQAQIFYKESMTLYHDSGDKYGLAFSLCGAGYAASGRGNYEQALEFLKESLTLRREIGDKLKIAESLTGLGYVTLYQANYEQARKFFEDSLILISGTRSYLELSNILGFIPILSDTNHLSQALILLGALETSIKSIGAVLQRSELKLQKQEINKIYEKLSPEEFSKYYEEGKKMTLEEATELALSSIK